ncbi:DUF1481 domain-containing protein [Vibrio hippocampi]|uniref:DUF1481 domain-containing protein n=1 Tax=Vibrio hippocampi TaxID=654686 RepID=A0ABN8DD34_9VIBR|nr:DUF1481 domain-containing protein [Vibrio hippocampi]CAH0524390.1 hypothetical protein VHP8226_00217 [Vibrio hippocampi]
MKKFLLPLLLATLIGCSSSTTQSLNRSSEYTGGQTLGDATSLYWYTERLSQPYEGADYVDMGDYGGYRSHYRWNDDSLVEFAREGVQNDIDAGTIEYKVHVRFNKSGEAVYQQYRRNGKVLPLRAAQLENYQREAQLLIQQVKKQDEEGLELIQGHWDGKQLETCNGIKFDDIRFEQKLPNFVIERLADVESYIAFLGATRLTGVRVEQLLMLKNSSADCLKRPVLFD